MKSRNAVSMRAMTPNNWPDRSPNNTIPAIADAATERKMAKFPHNFFWDEAFVVPLRDTPN